MKKNILITLIASLLLAIASFASAQTTVGYRIDVSSIKDSRSRFAVTYDPVLIQPLTVLHNRHIGDIELVSFAGMRTNNSSPFAGFGLMRRFEIFDNLPMYIGVQAQFENRSPIRGGLMFGVDLAHLKF